MGAKTRQEEIQTGIDWAYKQAIELLDKGVPYLHFYIMQNTSPFVKLMEKIEEEDVKLSRELFS